MTQSRQAAITPEMFSERFKRAENSPLSVKVRELPSGNKEVVISQTLCDDSAKPTQRVEFGFVAQGELATLDDNELVNVVTQAVAMGLQNGMLDLDKVNAH